MAKGYDYFSGSQEDINRRLLRKILALEDKVGNVDISDLEDDVTALKTAVGGESSGLVKDVADIEADIGTDTTTGTIKGRIKALENAQPGSTEPSEP